MHRAVEQLSKTPEMLLIDGNRFNKYKGIAHECIIKGDGKFEVLLNLEKGEKINQNDILFLRTNKVGLTRQKFFKNTKFKALKLKKN